MAFNFRSLTFPKVCYYCVMRNHINLKACGRCRKMAPAQFVYSFLCINKVGPLQLLERNKIMIGTGTEESNRLGNGNRTSRRED